MVTDTVQPIQNVDYAERRCGLFDGLDEAGHVTKVHGRTVVGFR